MLAWDQNSIKLIVFTVSSSRIFLGENGFLFDRVYGIEEYNEYSLVTWPWSYSGTSSFTHHCFCIISINANTVKKANNI